VVRSRSSVRTYNSQDWVIPHCRRRQGGRGVGGGEGRRRLVMTAEARRTASTRYEHNVSPLLGTPPKTKIWIQPSVISCRINVAFSPKECCVTDVVLLYCPVTISIAFVRLWQGQWQFSISVHFWTFTFRQVRGNSFTSLNGVPRSSPHPRAAQES
jgi:hypothetical protein